MNANLLLHVRKLPNGRVIVTPVEYPNLAVDAEDVPVARRRVLTRVAAHLRTTSGSMRAALANPVVAELDSVEVKIPFKSLRYTAGKDQLEDVLRDLDSGRHTHEPANRHRRQRCDLLR